MKMFETKKVLIPILLASAIFIGGAAGVFAFDKPWDSGHNTSNLPPNPPYTPPPNPCEKSTASPVYMKTGDLVLGFTDFSFPGGPIPMEIYRTYNCQERYNGPLGYGWVTSYTYQLIEVIKNNTIAEVIIRGDLGKRLTFIRNADGSFTPGNKGSYDVLVDNGDGTYTLNPIGQSNSIGLEYNFNVAGFLSSEIDHNGNSITFTYDSNNRLVSVADNVGRSFSYTYGSNDKVTTITDSTGRSISYTYDMYDNLTSVTDPMGRIVRYAYDSQHNLISLTDPKGNLAIEVTYDSQDRVATYKEYGDEVTYSYDTANNKTTKTDALGNSTVYTFNNQGVITNILYSDGSQESIVYDDKLNVLSFTDGRGNITTYTYDGNGNRTSITDALGNVTTYTYDPVSKRLLTETDPRGVITKYEYNASGNLTKKYLAFGTADQVEESFTYDTSGRKLTHTDFNGNTTTFSYDSAGNLLTTTDPDGNIIETNTYNSLGNRITKTDVFGNVTRFQYDSLGRLVATTNALGYVNSKTFDENGNIASETDGNGNTISYEYDFFNKLVKITDPLGNVREIGYTVRGEVKWTKDPLGNYLYYEYNDRGRLAKKIVKVGDTSETPDADDIVTTFEYDFSGNRTKTINPSGSFTTIAYDALNRVSTRTLPTGEVITYAYDAAGNRISEKYDTGLTMNYTYDNLNRVTSIKDGSGNTILTRTYDGLGNVLTETDGAGNTTTYEYDSRGKTTKRIYPDGTFDVIQYDAGGRMSTVTDRGGNSVTMGYDALNRIISTTDILGGVISATYDATRRLTLTDPNGNVTSYQYDASDRRIKDTFADGTFITYSYDANGKLISRTDPDGNTINFEYNERGLLTKRDFPGLNDDVFTYGPNSELLTAANLDATIARTYDDIGRILTETVNNVTVQYGYDTVNRIRTITYPGGRVVKEVYNGRERLTNIKDASDNDIFVYQYNSRNRRASLAYNNGVTAQFNYDTLGLMSNIKYSFSGSPFIDKDFGRGNTGRVASITDKITPSDSELYSYDLKDRLVGFKRGAISANDIPSPTREVSYSLDPVNNWLGKTADGVAESRTVNSLNAYLTAGNAAFSYDGNGSLIDDGIYLYSYDYMHHLTRVNRKADNSLVAEFKYDALGRLYSKTSSGTTTTYHYDTNFRILEEQVGGTTFATYVYGPNQDEVLQMETGGQDYYYHSDYSGNILAITDATGAVVESYQYDPYGSFSIFDGSGAPLASSAIGNAFFYKGKMYSPEIGLYYFRARFYSPFLGRFITRDPSGYNDGMNLYEYAQSDPINFNDPMGLAAAPAAKPTESCKLTESIEFQPDRVLGVVSVVLGTGGIDFEVKGKVAISVSLCSAKCCKKSITYTKWQLQADVTAQFESVIPGLGIQLPGGSKIGVIGNIQFGIVGSGTFSETFDKNCNVTCASEVCAGIFGGVGLMAGMKLEGGGDDEELGLEVGIAGSMKGSGTICYGCQGFKAQLCLEGNIELVAKVSVYFVSVGGSYQLAGGKICTGYPSS